jgi:hypothetical protein
MEQTKITQQITSFYKTTYDKSISAMNALQEQTEKMVNLSLERSPWLPEQSKNFINTWTKAYKKGYDDFKMAADDQYKKFETMFIPGEKVDYHQRFNSSAADIMNTVNKTKSI